MAETIVDLMRHGELVGGQRYRGWGIDDPLSPRGWEQMRQAIGDRCCWDQILSSPLQRCRSFATALAGRCGLPLAIDPDLREIGMGSWEGRSYQLVQAQEPERFAAFRRDPVGVRPPGGEPLDRFQQRVVGVYERQIHLYPGQRLLVICHAGVIRAILGYVLACPADRWYRLQVGHAAISQIRLDHVGLRSVAVQSVLPAA